MGKLVDLLKEYFENTPKEQLEAEWEEIKELNDIGPDVLEYAEHIRKFYDKSLKNNENNI